MAVRGINSLIPLSQRSPQLGAGIMEGLRFRDQREDRERRVALEDEAIQAARQQAAQQAAQLAEFESISRGVKKLTPLIPKSIGEVPRFISALDERIAEIESTGADARDTRAIRDLAVAGDFAGIESEFDQVRQIEAQLRAQRLGVDAPGGTGTQAAARGVSSRPGKVNGVEGDLVVTRLPDGTVKSEFIPAAEGFESTSRLGETGSEQSERAVQELSDKEKEKDRIERRDKAIDEGQKAADGLGTLNRGLQLLQEVSTGAPQRAMLWVRNQLGVTPADEGELSNLLGKAVLSQLRATFGAQFTADEGNRLSEIEAGFGKSVAANMRLLQNARDIAIRAAERGRRAALDVGDTFTVRELENAMQFTLGDSEGEVIEYDDGTKVTFK